MRYIIPFFLIMIVMTFSCKKESINSQPEVSISSPSENQFYQVLDTIPISVFVSDDKLVTSLSIKLVNESFIGVDDVLSFQIDSKEKNVNTEYVPQNVDLTGGVYHIEFKAFDEEEENREYVKINLGEFPLEWEGLLIAMENGEIGQWSPGANYSSEWMMSFDFTKGAINNRLDQLIAGDESSGDLKSYKIDNGNVEWESMGLGMSLGSYYRDIDYLQEEKIIIASNEDHQVRKFSSTGVDLGTIDVGVSFEVDQIAANGEFTFVEVSSMTQELHEFRTYFTPTNSLQYTDPFDGDILDMQFMNDNELLILSENGQGEGGLTIYNILNQSFDYFNLFSDTPLAMEILEGSKVAVSTLDSFYQYDFSTNQLVIISSDYFPSNLTYDIVNNQLNTSSGNIVRSYNVGGWQILDEIILPAIVTGIFDQYNK